MLQVLCIQKETDNAVKEILNNRVYVGSLDVSCTAGSSGGTMHMQMSVFCSAGRRYWAPYNDGRGIISANMGTMITASRSCHEHVAGIFVHAIKQFNRLQ